MKIKKDWWLANGILNILIGLSFIISKATQGMFSAGLFIGSINILIGLALFQRSKIIFWIVLIVNSFGFISELTKLSKSPGNYLPVIVNGIAFAFVVMLWQQIKKEETKN